MENKVSCIKFFVDEQGIKQYVLRDIKGVQEIYDDKTLKLQMRRGLLKVNNLLLTKDDKLREKTKEKPLGLFKYIEEMKEKGTELDIEIENKRVILKRVLKAINDEVILPDFVTDIAEYAFKDYKGDRIKLCSRMPSIKSLDRVFASTRVEVIDLTDFNAEGIKSMNYTFCDSTVRVIGFGNSFDIAVLESLRGTFKNCRNVRYLDIQLWNVREVVSMNEMCKGCYSLRTIDLGHWSVYQVIDMQGMFEDCKNLIEVIVPQVAISNINYTIKLNSMFANCEELTRLDMTHWTLQVGLINCYAMFKDCYKLEVVHLPSVRCKKCILTDMYKGLKQGYDTKKLMMKWEQK